MHCLQISLQYALSLQDSHVPFQSCMRTVPYCRCKTCLPQAALNQVACLTLVDRQRPACTGQTRLATNSVFLQIKVGPVYVHLLSHLGHLLHSSRLHELDMPTFRVVHCRHLRRHRPCSEQRRRRALCWPSSCRSDHSQSSHFKVWLSTDLLPS